MFHGADGMFHVEHLGGGAASGGPRLRLGSGEVEA